MFSPRIVIVSADPTFGYVVASGVSARRLSPEVFRSESEASQFLRASRTRPMGVILDVTLESGVSGTLTVERIRSDAATWDVPIAVCSCDPRFLSTYEGYLRGRDCDVFGKPLDLDAILDTIRQRNSAITGIGRDTVIAESVMTTLQTIH
jgi:DNA-binding response OmpR family regulator